MAYIGTVVLVFRPCPAAQLPEGGARQQENLLSVCRTGAATGHGMPEPDPVLLLNERCTCEIGSLHGWRC